MSFHEIAQHASNLPNATSTESFGYRFFFYADDQIMPFASMADSDNEYDNVSNLNRDGVYRVNIGVGKASYRGLFGEQENQWDYSVLNRFMPHPHYAAQHFICVLNPEGDVLLRTIQFLEEAHAMAKRRFDGRNKTV